MAYTVRPPEEKLRIVFEGIKAENISELMPSRGDMPERLLSIQGQGDRGSIGGLESEWTSQAGSRKGVVEKRNRETERDHCQPGG